MKHKFIITLLIIGSLCLSFHFIIDNAKSDDSATKYAYVDGYITHANANWNTLHHATTGTSYQNSTYGDQAILVNYDEDMTGMFSINRAFFNFDLQSYSAGTTFTSCTLYVYGKTYNSAHIIVMKGTQGNSLSTADFGSVTWTTAYSSEITTWSTSGYNAITLNSNALTNMVGGTIFQIVLVEYDKDYLDVSPPNNYNGYSGCYFLKYTGTDHDPYISFTYQVNPAPLTNFVVSHIAGSDNSLSITWTKGGGDYSHIRYSLSGYPTTKSEGTLAYNDTGSSTILSGLSGGTLYYFSGWSYSSTSHLFSTTYVTDNEATYGRPTKPTNVLGGYDLTNKYDILTWTLGNNATTTYLRCSLSTYPTTRTEGNNLVNTTNFVYAFPNTEYFKWYISLWTWDNIAKLWSIDYATCYIIINSTCPSCSITVYNNTAHTTGKYETSGSSIWLNFTGILPTFNHYENIVDATGTHEHKSSDNGYTINSWANYTGNIHDLTLISNLINSTGTLEHSLYTVWANITGNLTPLIHYENIVDATGTHQHILTPTGYIIWANYTGTGVECPDELQLYLFENFINATGYHNYTKNETGYLVFANVTGNNTGGIGNYSEDDFIFPIVMSISLCGFGLIMIRNRRKNEK